MIKKIISGGQTGADRAALDAAIKLGIPHGGWVPKGRLAEDGPLPAKYRLREMPTKSYPKRTEQNVLDSDGTAIFSHGKLTGGSKLTRDKAREHGKPYLHIELCELLPHLAVFTLRAWIKRHGVEILNVAGSRASRDPEIYDAVRKVIEGAYRTGIFKDQPESLIDPGEAGGRFDLPEPGALPTSLNQAVVQIIRDLSPEDTIAIAEMEPETVLELQATLGLYLEGKLKEWSVNEALMLDCVAVTGEYDLDEAEAAKVIIMAVWESLRKRLPPTPKNEERG